MERTCLGVTAGSCSGKRKRLRLRFDRELFEQPSREQFVIFHPAVVASRGIDDDFNRNAAVALLRCDRGFHQQSGESNDLIGADASVVIAEANLRRTTDEARHQRAQGESLGLRPVIRVFEFPQFSQIGQRRDPPDAADPRLDGGQMKREKPAARRAAGGNASGICVIFLHQIIEHRPGLGREVADKVFTVLEPGAPRGEFIGRLARTVIFTVRGGFHHDTDKTMASHDPAYFGINRLLERQVQAALKHKQGRRGMGRALTDQSEAETAWQTEDCHLDRVVGAQHLCPKDNDRAGEEKTKS